jgi:antirestriction protein
MIATTTGRMYVASLSDYNAGRLHGAWIDVPTDADELRESIAAILATSPEPIAEEWAIHDYDDFPNMGEWPDLDQLCAMAAILEEVAENGLRDEFTAWIEDSSYNTDNPERFHDAYLGTYESEEDYGYEYAESCGLVKQLEGIGMACYVDWESYGRNLLMDLSTIDGPHGFYVFDPRV